MQEIIDGIDPSKARLAFEEMLPLLSTQTELRRANTDMDKAVVVAASVGRMVKQPDMLAEFAALPGHRFDVLYALRLESAALAAWHAMLQARNAAAMTSGVKIPDDVMAAATHLKQTMLKVLDYYVGHLPGMFLLLGSIREGTGYVDLASDLARLSDLYQAHEATLAVDTVRYNATDREAAGRLAQAIHQVLGDGRHSDARIWSEHLARAWSLLVSIYEEVSATGRWLYRHEDGETRFPSLYAVGRQRRSRRPDQRDEIPAGSPDDGDVIADPGLQQG
ncbi:MAG TPA: hypothetical protein VNM90_08020 [Haliangium sp.]|nr:hypothetical protein [Haliangium sp.]